MLGPHNRGFAERCPAKNPEPNGSDITTRCPPSITTSRRCKAAATTTRYIFLDQPGRAGIRREAWLPQESQRAPARRPGRFRFRESGSIVAKCQNPVANGRYFGLTSGDNGLGGCTRCDPTASEGGVARGVTLTGGRPRLCYFESPDHIHALEHGVLAA